MLSNHIIGMFSASQITILEIRTTVLLDTQTKLTDGQFTYPRYFSLLMDPYLLWTQITHLIVVFLWLWIF